MLGLDVTLELTLVGIGTLLAGIGSLLAGLAALHRANAEPKPEPKEEEPKEEEWVKLDEET